MVIDAHTRGARSAAGMPHAAATLHQRERACFVQRTGVAGSTTITSMHNKASTRPECTAQQHIINFSVPGRWSACATSGACSAPLTYVIIHSARAFGSKGNAAAAWSSRLARKC